MYAVSSRPHPVVRSHLNVEMSDTVRRHQSAPCHAAGEAWRFTAENDVSHATMNTVGTDQQVSLGGCTIVKTRRHPFSTLLQADQPVADMQPPRRYGVGKQVNQVSAVEVIVGRAEVCLDLGTEWRPLQGSAIIPAPLMHREGSNADSVHRRPQPEAMQQSGRIGADLDAGTDFSDARRLLIDMDVEPDPKKLQRGGEPADAATDHCDFETHAGPRRNPPVELLSTCTVLFGLILICTLGSRGRPTLPTIVNSPHVMAAVVIGISARAFPPQMITQAVVTATARIIFASMSVPRRRVASLTSIVWSSWAAASLAAALASSSVA